MLVSASAYLVSFIRTCTCAPLVADVGAARGRCLDQLVLRRGDRRLQPLGAAKLGSTVLQIGNKHTRSQSGTPSCTVSSGSPHWACAFLDHPAIRDPGRHLVRPSWAPGPMAFGLSPVCVWSQCADETPKCCPNPVSASSTLRRPLLHKQNGMLEPMHGWCRRTEWRTDTRAAKTGSRLPRPERVGLVVSSSRSRRVGVEGVLAVGRRTPTYITHSVIALTCTRQISSTVAAAYEYSELALTCDVILRPNEEVHRGQLGPCVSGDLASSLLHRS